MNSTEQTKKLLISYFKAFAEKTNIEEYISDDTQWVGANMIDQTPMIGKQAYIDGINRFYPLFEAMRVTQMIVKDDKACVISNYDFIFPNGKKLNGNVAEIYTVKEGKINSLILFYDTLNFMNNM